MTLQALRAFRLVYLGTPYSLYEGGLDLAAREARILEAKLVANGVKAYSPVAHTHELAQLSGIDALDLNFWLEYDEPFMEAADALLIGELKGFEKSDGIDYEKDIFRGQGKPIFWVHPQSLEVRQ